MFEFWNAPPHETMEEVIKYHTPYIRPAIRVGVDFIWIDVLVPIWLEKFNIVFLQNDQGQWMASDKDNTTPAYAYQFATLLKLISTIDTKQFNYSAEMEHDICYLLAEGHHDAIDLIAEYFETSDEACLAMASDIMLEAGLTPRFYAFVMWGEIHNSSLVHGFRLKKQGDSLSSFCGNWYESLFDVSTKDTCARKCQRCWRSYQKRLQERI